MADVLLISTADWNHPIWTNKQHVACALADLGHRVLYVESLGLRAIRVDVADSRRLLTRILSGLRPPHEVRPGVWCWSPLVWPGARSPWMMALNRLVFRLGLALVQSLLRWRSNWVWTYNPKTLAYYRPSDDQLVIYHCVDDIQSQPGMSRVDLSIWEDQLCQRADLVFTTSPALQESRSRLNPQTHFFPNVADHGHFVRVLTDRRLAIPDDLTCIPNPRIGFVGAISDYKLDLQLLAALAASRPNWSLVMIGPIGEGEGSTDLSCFDGMTNVYFLGTRPYDMLPAYLKGIDVALLPLRKNSYTHAMFPMKFFEYLSAGLPVVATDIDSLSAYPNVVHLVAPEPQLFLDGIQRALAEAGDLAARKERSAFASKFNYRSRTMAMLGCISQISTAFNLGF